MCYYRGRDSDFFLENLKKYFILELYLKSMLEINRCKVKYILKWYYFYYGKLWIFFFKCEKKIFFDKCKFEIKLSILSYKNL